MSRVRFFLVVLLLVLGATPMQAEGPLKVVASFSILADFVRNVGGDRVDVKSLVGPNSDVHVYAPPPSDARKIVDARLLVINGLGLEGWLQRLLHSSGSRAPIVVASRGTTPLKLGSEADPHAWQSVENAKTYVQNIRDGLAAIDAADTDVFRTNAEHYLAQLDELDHEMRAAIAQIPPDRRKLISTHDAFGYFAAAYGVDFIAPIGVSTEAEPSASDISRIIGEIKAQKIPAVFLENISDPRLMRLIADETGAKIGGTLYSDSLSDEKGDAPTYIAMVRHNIKALTSALSP